MAENKDHYAIVIGVRYAELADLPGTAADAVSFAGWLTSPEGGGLPEPNVQVIISPTTLPANPFEAHPIAADVDRALVHFGADKGVQIGARLYFYFAGSASGTSLDDVLLFMANASHTRLNANIGLSLYRQFLRQSDLFDELVFVLDCAFLPLGPQAALPAGPSFLLPPNPRRTSVKELVLMSSPNSGTTVQQDDEGVAKPGLLTRAVLEGLRGAAASSRGGGELQSQVTAVSLGDYVRARVRDLVPSSKLLQLPEMLLPYEEMVFSTVAVSLLSGTLIVEVPHWSADVHIYTQFGLFAGPLKIEASHANPDIHQAELKLPEGIYKVSVTLEGQSEDQHVGIQFNKISTIKKDSWKNIKFFSAAPLAGTATTHEWHTGPAIEWSRKVTWSGSPGGAKRTSRLFLFVRTMEPQLYKNYSEGLKLLDASGNLITDFSSGVKSSSQDGWTAFCADMKPGYYILRRGRAGIRLRQQPLYLCAGWETHVFLEGRASPSLKRQSLHMARKGTGFEPNDEVALAAEAVLDGIRYGVSFKPLVMKENLSSLLHGKFENPWLGVLAAYALRTQLEASAGDPDPESSNLLTHVMGFLDQINDHPDVHALRLSEDASSPSPFPHPPLLVKGLKQVQRHSRKFSGIIPQLSLTELVLECLVEDSPWTAWRHLRTDPSSLGRLNPALVETGKTLTRILTGTALTHAATALQARSPKAPVLRIAEVIKDTGKKLSSTDASVQDITSFAVNALRDAPLLDAIQALMQRSDIDALPESVTLNHEQKINDLLQGIKAEEISRVTGLSLDHIQSSLERLRESGAQPAAAQASGNELELTTTDKLVLEYALAESAKLGDAGPQKDTSLESLGAEGDAPAADDGGADPDEFQIGNSPAVTIEDCVAVIRGEAFRILSEPEDAGADADAQTSAQAQTLGDRLRKIADALLSRAVFSVTTDGHAHIVYCNRAFISLITPADDFLKPDVRERKLKANHKAWEKVLAKAPLGQSALHNPVSGVIPEEFRLSRTAIQDEVSAKAKAYLNTMRGKDAASVKPHTLQQINELLPDLSRYASFFAYDSSGGRSAHASKLEALTQQLEVIVNGGTHPHS